ncbi:hypothetical protein CB1_000628005 [Camelus ferus]|nr:hypothetical protein CB1_000628005 [Camelus ferus]
MASTEGWTWRGSIRTWDANSQQRRLGQALREVLSQGEVGVLAGQGVWSWGDGGVSTMRNGRQVTQVIFRFKPSYRTTGEICHLAETPR